MKKKLLAIILASTLLVSAAGCGGSKGGKTSTGDNGKIKAGNTNLTWEEVKAKIPEKLKGTEITFYQWNEMSSVPDAKKVIDKFTEETGIKVNWTVTNWDDYATVLASKVATGESPDVVRLGATNASVVPYLMPLSDVDYDFTDQALSGYPHHVKHVGVTHPCGDHQRACYLFNNACAHFVRHPPF